MSGTEPKIIIAIDGPAASGKSTTARGVAKKLGYRYIDTGAMYRAITLKVLQQGINPNDAKAIEELLKDTTVLQEERDGEARFFLDGKDDTDKLRMPEVNRAIGPVCEVPAVREKMVALQRQLGKNGGVVLEGRDIGTVVFPQAELKVYLSANIRERARRRQLELRKRGISQKIETVIEDLIVRDNRDTKRQLSPLMKAQDAWVLDTTALTIEMQVDIIVNWARTIIRRKYEGQTATTSE
jgi:cytidylate kinase